MLPDSSRRLRTGLEKKKFGERGFRLPRARAAGYFGEGRQVDAECRSHSRRARHCHHSVPNLLIEGHCRSLGCIAVLKVFKLLRKRGFDPFIWQLALSHRNSGHIHIAIVTDWNDYRYICGCCKEAQKPIRNKRGGGSMFRVCNCRDCVACDPDIRIDMEQITRAR